VAYAGAEELELAEAEEHAEQQPAQRERHGGRRRADGAQARQRRGARQQQREEARLEEQAVPRVVQVRDEVEADHHAPGQRRCRRPDAAAIGHCQPAAEAAGARRTQRPVRGAQRVEGGWEVPEAAQCAREVRRQLLHHLLRGRDPLRPRHGDDLQGERGEGDAVDAAEQPDEEAVGELRLGQQRAHLLAGRDHPGAPRTAAATDPPDPPAASGPGSTL